VDIIKGFHWLTHQGGKFSTSRRRGIFADAALEELPAGPLALVADRERARDRRHRFFHQSFRCRHQQGPSPTCSATWSTARSVSPNAHSRACVPTSASRAKCERALAAEIDARVARLHAHHEALEFRRAAAETRAIWVRANAYLQDAAPWTSFSSNPARAAAVTRTALNLIRLSAIVAWSIIPGIAGRVLAAFGEHDKVPRWPTQVTEDILSRERAGPIAPIGLLVDKICDDHVARLEQRFGGT
jgi:methionyl-tRNA synthetase